jgi:hypothetical protein
MISRIEAINRIGSLLGSHAVWATLEEKWSKCLIVGSAKFQSQKAKCLRLH